MAFKVAYTVVTTLYVLTWVVRFLVKRVHPVVALSSLVAMSVGLASDGRGSTILFWAGFFLGMFACQGGDPWIRRKAASLSSSLTDVVRAAIRRDVSASA